MNELGYYRQPTIHGETIVFVSEDDLWTVAATGGDARRLTASAGEVTHPHLSPDGTTVAFVGRDEGHPEVYTIPARGGPPQRLTFLGSEACVVCGWSPSGDEIYFVSDATSPFVKETTIMAIPRDGGPPRSLELGGATWYDVSTDGGLLIGRNATDTARWKRYRGGTAGEIWIDPNGSGTFARLTSLPGPVVPFWLGGRPHFISDHEGIANLYSCATDGSDLQRLSDEREYFARFPATDGKRVVYQAGAQIMLYTPGSGVARVPVEAPSAAPQAARRFVEAGGELDTSRPPRAAQRWPSSPEAKPSRCRSGKKRSPITAPEVASARG